MNSHIETNSKVGSRCAYPGEESDNDVVSENESENVSDAKSAWRRKRESTQQPENILYTES